MVQASAVRFPLFAAICVCTEPCKPWKPCNIIEFSKFFHVDRYKIVVVGDQSSALLLFVIFYPKDLCPVLGRQKELSYLGIGIVNFCDDMFDNLAVPI